MPNLSDYNPAVKYGANLDVNANLADVRDQNDNEVVEFEGVASAVNYIHIENAATGANPRISGTGEADLGITFLNDQAEEIVIMDAAASAVNEITFTNAATAADPSAAATGDDTNINFQLTPKGTGIVLLASRSNGTEAAGSVTINAQRGRITTSALTTSSATVYNFDFVNNKLIGKDHPVLLTVSGGGNTGGRPFVFVNKLDAVGSAQISVGNAGVAVLNGTVVISFLVI